jgi:hypothetical protein
MVKRDRNKVAIVVWSHCNEYVRLYYNASKPHDNWKSSQSASLLISFLSANCRSVSSQMATPAWRTLQLPVL